MFSYCFYNLNEMGKTFSGHLNMGLETSSQLHVAPADGSPAQLPYLSSGRFTGLLTTLAHTDTQGVLVDKKQLQY